MIVGIDLGTTNSLVAVWRDGGTQLVSNALGELLTPSVVGLDDDGRCWWARPRASVCRLIRAQPRRCSSATWAARIK